MTNYSVLMSLYKGESPIFFEQSVMSMVNQTAPADEIVVVVDGQLTIELNRVLNKLSKYLTILRLEENQGLGNALNYGLKFVKNNYVVRMDTDDISVPDRCKVQIDFMNSHPDVSVVGSSIREFSENKDGIKDRIKGVPTDYESIYKYAKRRNPMNHMSVCFRKRDVLDVHSYQDFSGFEDYHLWIRMLLKGYKFANIKTPLVKVRISNGMVARRTGISYLKSELRFQKFLLNSNFITNIDYVVNIFSRGFVRILPSRFVGILYKLLRD